MTANPGGGDYMPDAITVQEDDMCPNCVTPWKCNGPHELAQDAPDATETPAHTPGGSGTAEARTEAQSEFHSFADDASVRQRALDHYRLKRDSATDPGMTNLEAELVALRRWKAEATEVILGLQDLGNALGLPLGERITGTSAAAVAKAMRDRVARIEALAERWEAAETWDRKPAMVDRGFGQTLRVALDGA